MKLTLKQPFSKISTTKKQQKTHNGAFSPFEYALSK